MNADPTHIIAIARSWLGTPYHDQASLRGVGCDCLGLARGVWREIVGPEDFGVPQRRHRVIIVGIRSDLAADASGTSIVVAGPKRTVADAIGGLSSLRSGLSRGDDSAGAWRSTVIDAAKLMAEMYRTKDDVSLRDTFSTTARRLRAGAPPSRMSAALPDG